MTLSNILVVLVVIAAISISLYFTQDDEDAAILQSTPPGYADCHKIGENIVFGPEDISLATENIAFISSHNRRDAASVGAIYMMDVTTEHIELCEPDFTPPYFRPHGLSIANCNGVSRLFVISHRLEKAFGHYIEVFDHVPGTSKLTHIKSLTHELLVFPNDLIALNCEEIIVSNDHGSDFIPQMLYDDLFKLRKSEMAHYDGKFWHPLPASPAAAFGNGLIVRRAADGNNYLIRSSAGDSSLLTFAMTRSGGEGDDHRGGNIELKLVYDEKLPFLPDNIESDPVTGGIIITGHPSTTQFLLHAVLGGRAPSAVILYHAPKLFSTFYYDATGDEISAASVAIRPFYSKLFIGQVFDPFILVCNQQIQPL
jgi:arylesterase / paraoxonase